MPYAPGFEEDGFLKSLSPFEPEEIELKADNCTKVRVADPPPRAALPLSRLFSPADPGVAHADEEERALAGRGHAQIQQHEHSKTEADPGLASGKAGQSPTERRQRSPARNPRVDFNLSVIS